MSHINESTHLELINALNVAIDMIDYAMRASGKTLPSDKMATRDRLIDLADMARREAKLAGLLPQDRPEVRA